MRPLKVLGHPQVGSVASQAVAVGSLAAMNILVVRYWGAAERGHLAVFVVLTTISATLGGLGFADVAVSAHGKGFGGSLGPLFRRSLGICALTGFGGAVVALSLLPWGPAVLVLPGTLLLHLFRSSIAVQLASGDFLSFNVERTAMPIATIGGIVLVTLTDDMTPIAGYVVGQAVAAILAARAIRRHGLFRTGGSLPISFQRLGRESVAGNLVSGFLSRLDVLAVAALASPAATGIYSVALSASEVSLTGAYGLSFHALRDGATSGVVDRRTMHQAVLATATLSLLVGLGLFVFAEPILGNAFAHVDLTFGLLAPGILALTVVRLRFSADLTAGRGQSATRALLIATVSMLMLDVLLVPAFEQNGAAIASSTAYLVAWAALANRPYRKRRSSV